MEIDAEAMLPCLLFEGVPGQPQKRTGSPLRLKKHVGEGNNNLKKQHVDSGGLEGSSLCTGLKRTKHLGKDSLQTAILRLGSS